MTNEDGWRPGRYRVICDRSGRKCWDDEVKREWDGSWVYEKYWEPRHPQERIRSKLDQKPVPIPRPQAPYEFASFPMALYDETGDLLIDEVTETMLLAQRV